MLTILLVGGINAQNANLTITLRDGDVISGQAQMKSVTLETKYGKLVIPIKDVNEIEVGVSPDNANKTKYINLAKQLASGTEELAKKAFDQLLDAPIGAIPILEEFAFSDESVELVYLPGYSLNEVINALKGKYNLQNYSPEDIISINYQYRMGGQYNFKNISLKTEFGTLNIPKEKISKIEVFYNDPNNKNLTFKLIASKHISGNPDGGWLRTGIYVKAGQTITINASGIITLASLSNNQYTPDGKSDETYDGDYIAKDNYPTYGNVVFKIGESGEIQKAGSHYTGVASRSGVLYLSIYETVYNPANKGYYIVKVAVK